jgi:hypothetical protein
MEEVIADYIVSASHLDQLRASRCEVGATLDGSPSRSPSRDDPSSPRRFADLAARLLPASANLTLDGGGSGGDGSLHRRIAMALDGMRCGSAALRGAVRAHEAPAQRDSLSRSLRVRPGRLAPQELLRSPLSPSSPPQRQPTGTNRSTPPRPASGAGSGRVRPASAAVVVQTRTPPRAALPHALQRVRANSFSCST